MTKNIAERKDQEASLAELVSRANRAKANYMASTLQASLDRMSLAQPKKKKPKTSTIDGIYNMEDAYGKTIATIHFGNSSYDPDKMDTINLSINPRLWGSKMRVDAVNWHKGSDILQITLRREEE